MYKQIILTKKQDLLLKDILNSNKDLLVCELCKNIHSFSDLSNCFYKTYLSGDLEFFKCDICNKVYHKYHDCLHLEAFAQELSQYLNIDRLYLKNIEKIYNIKFDNSKNILNFLKELETVFNFTISKEISNEIYQVDCIFKSIKKM